MQVVASQWPDRQGPLEGQVLQWFQLLGWAVLLPQHETQCWGDHLRAVRWPYQGPGVQPLAGPKRRAPGGWHQLAGIADADMEELAAALATTGGNSTAADIPAKFDKYKVAN